jgi:methionyl aminopeptidase
MFNYNQLNSNFRGVNKITTSKKIPIINGLEDTENSLIKGGIIHHEVRKELQKILKPGIKTSEIAECIEKNTRKFTDNKGINNGIGFPASLAVSHCAAHYHPSDTSDIVVNYNDNIKVDFGVIVNGWIVDSAFSIYFDPKYDKLHEAAKDCTYTGIKNAGVDVRIKEWGKDNQEVMESYEIELDGSVYPIKAIKNLGGHNILNKKIHGGVFLPACYIDFYPEHLKFKEGVYAVETFGGIDCSQVIERPEENTLYMVNNLNGKRQKNKNERKFLKKIVNKFQTIPFTDRYLKIFDVNYKPIINKFVSEGVVKDYPPLYADNNKMTAQYEHTIVLSENGKNVISQFEDY